MSVKLIKEALEEALKVVPYEHYATNQEILEQCIDTKGQRVVSIERLAKELGVKAPSKEEIERIVEGRK